MNDFIVLDFLSVWVCSYELWILTVLYLFRSLLFTVELQTGTLVSIQKTICFFLFQKCQDCYQPWRFPISNYTVGELIYTCKVIFAGETCIFCQVWTWQNKPEKYVRLDPRLKPGNLAVLSRRFSGLNLGKNSG